MYVNFKILGDIDSESLAKIPIMPFLGQDSPWLRSFWSQSIDSGQGYSGPVLGRYVRVCGGRCIYVLVGASCAGTVKLDLVIKVQSWFRNKLWTSNNLLFITQKIQDLGFFKLKISFRLLISNCFLIITPDTKSLDFYRINLFWSLICHSKISKGPSKRNSMLNLGRFSMEVGYSPLIGTWLGILLFFVFIGNIPLISFQKCQLFCALCKWHDYKFIF